MTNFFCCELLCVEDLAVTELVDMDGNFVFDCPLCETSYRIKRLTYQVGGETEVTYSVKKKETLCQD